MTESGHSSYPNLDRIGSPADLKGLTEEDLVAVCEEMRAFLLDSVQETGGHLGSNTGVVELATALHTVFDFRRDRLVWDVSHQCYPHKILTGRREGFANLRKTDVVGGSSFISSSFEYRFPISESIGLQGVAFVDMGNAFSEGNNLFDVTEWRYGTGAGLLWFSPFGPLQVVLGFPLNRLSIEKSMVFEFSVGGAGL